jgi:hypothetical protein
LACYRNRGLRVGGAVALAGEAVGVGCAMAATYPTLGAMIVLPLVLILGVVAYMIATRPRVYVSRGGLTVVGYYDSYELRWDEVAVIDVSFNPFWHGQTGRILTRDGRRIFMYALDAGRGEGPGFWRLHGVVDELQQWQVKCTEPGHPQPSLT